MYNRRPSQGESDSSDQKNGRGYSYPSRKQQRESNSRVPRGQQRRGSTNVNSHERHAQSRSEDEESSKKKENRVQSQSEDGESSKRGSECSKRLYTSAASDRTGECTRPGSQAASMKTNTIGAATTREGDIVHTMIVLN